MHLENIPTGARPAARIILIDGRDRILFCRGEEPETGRSFWVMPGGGLEPGETFEQAVIREAHEETGLIITPGPCVWHRHHRHEWNGKIFDQFEKFFVARVPPSSHVSGGTPDSYIKEYRWWTLEEIAASSETFAPRRAADLLHPLVLGHLVDAPFDCGV